MRNTLSRWIAALPIVFLFALIALTPAFGWFSKPAAAAGRRSAPTYVPMALSTHAAEPTAAERLELQVVELTNQLRKQHGCPALTISPELAAAARSHSQDMAANDYLDHLDREGRNPGDRARRAGYRGNAGWENIAAGYPTAAEVVSGWYNETPPNDGHRRNILDCSLTEIGVGYAVDPNSQYGSYWTQDFGRR